MSEIKNKLLAIFVAFVRKTFTKERILDLIGDLLDIVYDRFGDSFCDLKEECDTDEV